MTWFAFEGGYGTMDLAGAQEKQAVTFGFHGWPTEKDALAHRNKVNLLQAAGLNALEDEYKALGGQHGLVGARSPVGNPLTGINAIGDFFHRLTEAQTWIRVGEFTAGALLLYLGLSAMMKGTAAGNAVQTARSNAGKVARVISK